MSHPTAKDESALSATSTSQSPDHGVDTAPQSAKTPFTEQSSSVIELKVENVNKMIQHIQEDLKDEKIQWSDWSSCFDGMAWRLLGGGDQNLRCLASLESFLGVSAKDAWNLAYMDTAPWSMFDEMPYPQQHAYLINVLEHLRDTGDVKWPDIYGGDGYADYGLRAGYYWAFS